MEQHCFFIDHNSAFGCSSHRHESVSEEAKVSWMLPGDSMTTEMQNVLLKNVAGSIQKGGTDYAIEFCNMNAMSFTDSIAGNLQVSIQRLSDRNHNPGNAIQAQTDSLAWEKVQSGGTDFLEQNKCGEIY